MKFKTGSPFRRCPRCKEKCFVHEKSCHECGLIFERLNYVSNKSAKKNLLRFNKKDVIMTADWPYDAKKLTALLLSGFLGFSGAHNFYLGRFFKGLFVLVGLLLSLTGVLLTEFGYFDTTVFNVIRYLAIIPGSSVLIFWVSDFFSIFLERYKIPVSIDESLYEIKDNVILTEKDSKIIENTDDKKEEVDQINNEKTKVNIVNNSKNNGTKNVNSIKNNKNKSKHKIKNSRKTNNKNNSKNNSKAKNKNDYKGKKINIKK